MVVRGRKWVFVCWFCGVVQCAVQALRLSLRVGVLGLFALGVLALGACGESTLGRGFDATDSTTRLKAIREAASANDQTAIASLAHLLDDDDPAVRVASIAALRKLTGADLGYSPADPSEVRRAIGRRFVETYAVTPKTTDAKPGAETGSPQPR